MDVERTSRRMTNLLAARQGQKGQVRAEVSLVAVVDGVAYVQDNAHGSSFENCLMTILDLGRPLVWLVDAAWATAMDERVREFMKENLDATVFFGPVDHAMVEAMDAEVGTVYGAEDLRTAVFAARELAIKGGMVLFAALRPTAQGEQGVDNREAVFQRAVMDL